MCTFRQGLSTGSVFNALNLAQCSKVSPESLLERFTEDGPLKASAQGCLINDLEDPAFECDKTLDTIKKFFVASAKESITGSMMSGSGTSLYALGNGVRDRDQEFFDEFDPSMVLMSVPGLRYYRASFLNKPDTVEDWYEVDKTRGIFG
jgi:4-diphosphocytidyl-2C-methyl-D-erythritol kinase